MTKTGHAILQEAMKLDVADRADLAAELLASLDGESEEDVDAACAAEIERRLARIDTGEEHLIPWDEVRKQVDARILKL